MTDPILARSASEDDHRNPSLALRASVSTNYPSESLTDLWNHHDASDSHRSAGLQ